MKAYRVDAIGVLRYEVVDGVGVLVTSCRDYDEYSQLPKWFDTRGRFWERRAGIAIVGLRITRPSVEWLTAAERESRMHTQVLVHICVSDQMIREE